MMWSMKCTLFFFTLPVLPLYSKSFYVVLNLVHCDFFFWFHLHVMDQAKGKARKTAMWQKSNSWSPNITKDKGNCWSQEAEKKICSKCKNFQSGIGAIWPVKLKGVCGRRAVPNQTHVWKRQTGHGKECRIFQKQWTVSANCQTIRCEVELCVNERGVFLKCGL